MNKIITLFLAIILALMFSLAALSEAQTMDKNLALSAKQQGIIPIAAFTAKGDLEKLKVALHGGLDAGLTVNEIKEILVQLYAYAGFPRSLNGINTFMGVMEERQKKGIKDEAGKEASPLPANKSSVERGTDIQTRLVGKPVSGAIYSFAPAIDQFLKGHLFGDIFGRDNLDFQSREIATISALAGMEGVNPQLQAHFNVSMNVGLTEVQLRQFVSVLGNKVGKNEAARATRLLDVVLEDRKASSPTHR
jgi:alkylhydroperoxidase/carboxymuconolactone decarboxylase family protein YurZ